MNGSSGGGNPILPCLVPAPRATFGATQFSPLHKISIIKSFISWRSRNPPRKDVQRAAAYGFQACHQRALSDSSPLYSNLQEIILPLRH
ncbi:hypothetical protein J6590_080252 [Homalodisca vitripennis]|nr:hypothetical protein J6590_080252 [Homalodisca vitripennis]